MSSPLGDAVKRARRFALYLFLRPPLEVFRRLPPRASAAVGGVVGSLAFRLFPHEVRRARNNIARALPGLSVREREAVLAGHLRHLGRSMGEFLSHTTRQPEMAGERVRFEGMDLLKGAAARGRGVVVLTGHFGNWEMAAAAISGQVPRMAVVARELYDINLSRFVERLRAHFGVKTFDNRDGAGIYRHLKGGGVLFTLVDQESRKVSNVPAPIFGQEALAPSGPVILAARAGSALLAGFACPDPAGHLAVFEEMPVPDEGAPEKTLMEFNRRLETRVVKWPEQWIWLHNRWRGSAGGKGIPAASAALAVLVGLLLGACGDSPVSGRASGGASRDMPRSLMRGANLMQVAKGRLEVEINALEAVNSADGRWVDGKVVKVTYYQEDGTRAVLRSGAARYDFNRKVLVATGGVRVEAGNGILEAQDLVWDAGRRSLVSNGFVRVTRGENILTGWGLEADPELEKVVIKEDVRIIAKDPGELAPLAEEERRSIREKGRQ